MTITGINVYQDLVMGYITWNKDGVSNDNPNFFAAGELIIDDLSEIILPPDYVNMWLVNWTAYFYADTIRANVSRYKSALPKYDLGCIDAFYKGAQTFSTYYNYLSQRTANFTFWGENIGIGYPSEFAPAEITTNTTLSFQNSGSNGDNCVATDLCFTLPGVELDNFSVNVFYLAGLYSVGAPAQFSDI